MVQKNISFAHSNHQRNNWTKLKIIELIYYGTNETRIMIESRQKNEILDAGRMTKGSFRSNRCRLVQSHYFFSNIVRIFIARWLKIMITDFLISNTDNNNNWHWPHRAPNKRQLPTRNRKMFTFRLPSFLRIFHFSVNQIGRRARQMWMHERLCARVLLFVPFFDSSCVRVWVTSNVVLVATCRIDWKFFGLTKWIALSTAIHLRFSFSSLVCVCTFRMTTAAQNTGEKRVSGDFYFRFRFIFFVTVFSYRRSTRRTDEVDRSNHFPMWRQTTT